MESETWDINSLTNASCFPATNVIDVVIPKVINGKQVLNISDFAFYKYSSSNKNSTSIINKSSNSFDWTSITHSGTSD